jgi:hypothetical protein
MRESKNKIWRIKLYRINNDFSSAKEVKGI